MTKPHATLRLEVNLMLIVAWALAAAIFATLSETLPILEIALGSCLGVLGGYIQSLSFKEGRGEFLKTKTALEVRAKLEKTVWGKRYIYFLWGSGITLAIVSISISTNLLLSFPAAYFGMMFFREIVTLKPIHELWRIQK